MHVRPYDAADQQSVIDFAGSVPDEDRNFLKEDAAEPRVVTAWAGEPGVTRFLALSGEDVVGYVALHRMSGWSDHVAEMRLLVDPRSRGLGVGQRLVRTAIATAVDQGLVKLVTEVIADHDSTLGMLQANGFVPEALLTDQVRDRSGQLRDMLVLSCRTDEILGDLQVTGIDIDIAD